MKNEQPVVFYRQLSDTQKKRINQDHKASVQIGADGQFQYLSEQIITPKGLSKENRKISVLPDTDERVLKLREAKYLFGELQHMNIILTNACNLSCTYCYEQHKKDYGRFTEESLLEAYNFLLNISNNNHKTFQFFGGEPLIHKDLILSFIENNKEYLSENAKGNQQQVVSLITNGVLLSPEFIDKYFSYDFTWMMISLDTFNAEYDHRELTQDQIDGILRSIYQIPEDAKRRIYMRCTLSRETAPQFTEYCDTIYEAGVRAIIVHPLVLDSQAGFIRWTDNEWNKLHSDILQVMDKYPDLTISFSEGVGKKGENNCMIGSDMIAIDGSGDFSGCYFFTNQKGGPTSKMILGNLYNDTIFIDRYQTFQKNFIDMIETEEQCRTCDYKNACYQCPAGNMDTGSRMFRPDDMCQKIVKLYLDLQADVTKKQFTQKFNSILKAVELEGENYVFSKSILHLMYRMFSGKHPSPTEKKETPDIQVGELYAVWKNMVENKVKPNIDSYVDFVNSLPINCSNSIDIKTLYEFIINRINLPTEQSRKVTDLNLETKAGYLTLLHIFVLSNKDKNFDGSLVEKLLNQ